MAAHIGDERPGGVSLNVHVCTMNMKVIQRPLAGFGTTYGPPGDGPFPAIVILHGSEGGWSGWSHRDAVLLACAGYLAFPFAYGQDGNIWNAGNIIDVALDRTLEAMAVLRDLPCAGSRLGLYGASRGAEHALLLTALMARDGMAGLPDAVAGHAAPDVICGAFNGRIWRDTGDPGWQAWDPARRAWRWRGRSDDLLPSTPIEIERYGGPLFLSHGTADTIWSADMTRRLAARLQCHGRQPEIHFYEGQDHMPNGAEENAHLHHLLAFFGRHLAM